MVHWVAMCFLFIPSLLGVIIGASLMWLRTAKKSLPARFANKQESHVPLFMHPARFTVPVSDNEEIVERSIEEFEYPTTFIRWMGYGRILQDPNVTFHIGRQGPVVSNTQLTKDFPQRRETRLRSQNDENKWGPPC